MQKTIDDYLNSIQGIRSPKTCVTYSNSLQAFVAIVGNDAPLTKETYIKFLRSSKDMHPATQALCRSAVKGLYQFAADTIGGVDTSFFHQADFRYALKASRRLILFNREGIEKTLDYVSTIRSKPEEFRDRAFLFLLADSGLRVSEACNLRVGDLDLLEQRAVVIGKGDKQALIHISNRTADAIREYLRTRTVSLSSPLFMRHDKRAGSEVKQVTPAYMWHYVKQRIAEAGSDPATIRIHDFRHYFVTFVYQAKGIKLAQKLARHERISTTDRYTHLVEDEGEAYDEIFNH